MTKGLKYSLGMTLLIVALFVVNLLVCSVKIPASEVLRILLLGQLEFHSLGVALATSHHSLVVWWSLGGVWTDAANRLQQSASRSFYFGYQ